MTTTTIGYTLAGLIAGGIIFIGARFIVAPRVAAAGYGVQPDLSQRSAGPSGAACTWISGARRMSRRRWRASKDRKSVV